VTKYCKQVCMLVLLVLTAFLFMAPTSALAEKEKKEEKLGLETVVLTGPSKNDSSISTYNFATYGFAEVWFEGRYSGSSSCVKGFQATEVYDNTNDPAVRGDLGYRPNSSQGYATQSSYGESRNFGGAREQRSTNESCQSAGQWNSRGWHSVWFVNVKRVNDAFLQSFLTY
jgi:hypothetical protein